MKRHFLCSLALCVAALFVFTACEKDEKTVPVDAGAITGDTENVCPVRTIDLSIAAIDLATTYVWYQDGTEILGSTGLTLNVDAIGSHTYTAAGKNEQGVGKQSPAKIVTIVPCNPPADAAAITGPDANTCPADSVILIAPAIDGAEQYVWYKDGAAAATVSVSAFTYTVKASGSYQVAGVNVNGEGTKSPAKVITIDENCPDDATPGAGTITGDTQNICPAATVELTATDITNAVTYQWYKDGAPIASATAATYVVTESGSYTVAGVNAYDEEGAQTAEQVVTIVTDCTVGAAGPITATSNGLPVSNYGTNICPDPTVVLSVPPVTNASSYNWYLDTASSPTAVTPEPAYTVTTVGSNQIYKVAGADAENNEGALSNSFYVTIATVPTTTAKFYINNKSITPSTYTNLCGIAAEQTSLRLSYNPAASIVQIIWRKNGTVVKEETRAAASATFNEYIITEVGTATYTGQYVNACGAAPESVPMEITFRDCSAGLAAVPPKPTPLTSRTGALETICASSQYRLWVDSPLIEYASTYVFYIDRGDGSGYVPFNDPTNSGTSEQAYNGTLLYIGANETGTYTVAGKNAIGEGAKADGLALTIHECQPAKPTFSGVVPTGNVCPATEVVVTISVPGYTSNPPASYTWYKNDVPKATVAVAANASSSTYAITETGVWTVKGLTKSGAASLTSVASDPITVTIGTCPAEGTVTRTDLLGTYNVTDQRGASGMIGYGWTDVSYTVTIEAGANANEIVIKKIGNAVDVTAEVDFATGYGLAEIWQQNVTYNSNTRIFSGCRITANFLGATVQWIDPFILNITYIGGKLSLTSTGTYGVTENAIPNALPSEFAGGNAKLVMTKQ